MILFYEEANMDEKDWTVKLFNTYFVEEQAVVKGNNFKKDHQVAC